MPTREQMINTILYHVPLLTKEGLSNATDEQLYHMFVDVTICAMFYKREVSNESK